MPQPEESGAPVPGAPERSDGETALSRVLGRLARARPRCILYARSASDHVLQVYAGFYALHAAGAIELRQRFGARALGARLSPPPIDARFLSSRLDGLFADVEGAGLVFFDMRDGGNSYSELAARVALYAKRSCPPGRGGKVVPLGLNYAVYPDRTRWPELVRAAYRFDGSALAAKRLALSLVRLHPALGRRLDVPTVSALSSPPQAALAPRVIFYARAWSREEVPRLAPAALDALNDSRAACIRALRARFGGRFAGGLARSAFALQRYPDCVADSATSTRRRDYVKRVRAYPVCVATTGLSGSIGWKFAEYVALARAIVTEPVGFALPGPIAAPTHYLEFRSAGQCVERVAELLDDPPRAQRMMEANRAYYLEYGAPEAIVGRVLARAIENSAAVPDLRG